MSDLTTKRCTMCGQEYPLTAEYFNRRKNSRDGYRADCKACCHQRGKKYYQEHSEEIKDKSARWYSENKESALTAQKEYRTQNPEVARAANKRYFEKNKEIIYEKARKRRLENPEKAKESARKHRENHREERRLAGQEYAKANPDIISAKWKRYRARKLNAEGSHTETELKGLYEQQRGLCFHCGSDLLISGYHADHWIPLTRGGSDWIENIRLLCPYCNRSKSNKLPHEWCPERYQPE